MFVVFDLDGTLSDPTHRNELFQCPEKGPPHLRAMTQKEWDVYSLAGGEDAPNLPILRALETLAAFRANRVEIWTGRADNARAVTEWWLEKHGIPGACYKLRMRPRGDHTPDFELKAQWMREWGKPDLVFEDRQRVVDMWRANGVMCAQVAPGNF